jgi:hypothetical protein
MPGDAFCEATPGLDPGLAVMAFAAVLVCGLANRCKEFCATVARCAS